MPNIRSQAAGMVRGSKIANASKATARIPEAERGRAKALDAAPLALTLAAVPVMKIRRFMSNDRTRACDGLLQQSTYHEVLMNTFKRQAVCVVLALAFATRAAMAGDFFEADGFALHGYDPVAYLESDQPVKGSAAHAFIYKGSKFLFATDQNLKKFAADPDKYSPQYGGYCALGTANGYKVSTQPDAFKVVDGKLYLNHDRKVLDIWNKDVPGNIAKADQNWPTVSKQPLKQ
jgi:YHS domain-containing protein